MLAEREPVPQRVNRNGLARSVLAKAAHEMAFEARGVAAQLHQARRQRVVGIPTPPKGEVRAVPAELLVPRIREQLLLQLRPRRDADLVHRPRSSADVSELHSPRGSGACTPAWIRASTRAETADNRVRRRGRARGACRKPR